MRKGIKKGKVKGGCYYSADRMIGYAECDGVKMNSSSVTIVSLFRYAIKIDAYFGIKKIKPLI